MTTTTTHKFESGEVLTVSMTNVTLTGKTGEIITSQDFTQTTSSDVAGVLRKYLPLSAR